MVRLRWTSTHYAKLQHMQLVGLYGFVVLFTPKAFVRFWRDTRSLSQLMLCVGVCVCMCVRVFSQFVYGKWQQQQKHFSSYRLHFALYKWNPLTIFPSTGVRLYFNLMFCKCLVDRVWRKISVRFIFLSFCWFSLFVVHPEQRKIPVPKQW